MDENIKTWMYDILASIAEIESYFCDKQMIFVDYCKDMRTKRAVERNIEIIGEAMNRIIKNDACIEISNARIIVDVRNRIIHGYDSVSDEAIWGIIVKHIPVLKTEINRLLAG